MTKSQEKQIEKSEFGIFIGFYNRANGVSVTIKEAMMCPVLQQYYRDFKEQIKMAHANNYRKINYGNTVTTRRQSLTKVNTAQVDLLVWDTVKTKDRVSRSELSKLLGKKESTICGAVNRLIKERKLFVSGTTYDTTTNRNVEVVSALSGN